MHTTRTGTFALRAKSMLPLGILPAGVARGEPRGISGSLGTPGAAGILVGIHARGIRDRRTILPFVAFAMAIGKVERAAAAVKGGRRINEGRIRIEGGG